MGHGKAIPLAANASQNLGPGMDSVCLFLPTVSGTITITSDKGVVLLNAYPVTAGVYVPLDFYVGGNGQANITLGSTAAGTLIVN